MGHISVFQMNDPKSMNFFLMSESFALAVKDFRTPKILKNFARSFHKAKNLISEDMRLGSIILFVLYYALHLRYKSGNSKL